MKASRRSPERSGSRTGPHLCELDGALIETPAAVYEALARSLGFPAWFRPNLDALSDMLTREVPGPVEIVWRNSGRARRRLGADFDRLKHVLEGAAASRADLRVRFE